MLTFLDTCIQCGFPETGCFVNLRGLPVYYIMDPVYVVISYCPLLTGPTWPMQDLKSEDAEAFVKTMEELPSGSAKGCLWVSNDDKGITPVFLFENASAIYEHLMFWSEDKPEEWFEYIFREKGGRYAIVCFPRLQKSIERWKINFQLNVGFPPHPQAKYSLLFKPLHFISQSANIFNKIKKQLKSKELSIGLLDWAGDFPPDPSNINFDGIQWVRMPVAKKSVMYNKYLTELFG
jgi:hypothetical protein